MSMTEIKCFFYNSLPRNAYAGSMLDDSCIEVYMRINTYSYISTPLIAFKHFMIFIVFLCIKIVVL